MHITLVERPPGERPRFDKKSKTQDKKEWGTTKGECKLNKIIEYKLEGFRRPQQQIKSSMRVVKKKAEPTHVPYFSRSFFYSVTLLSVRCFMLLILV